MIITFAILGAIWITLVAWLVVACRAAAQRPIFLPRL